MRKRNGVTWEEMWARLDFLPPAPTYYIYRLYNEHGDLIYVGKTVNIRSRMRGHWNDSGWFIEVNRMEVEECDSEADALERELSIIRSATPKHNRRHTGRGNTAGGYMQNC